jgi:hypothetical protein
MLDFTHLSPRQITSDNFYDVQQACSTLYSFIQNHISILPFEQHSVINSIQSAIIYASYSDNLYYLYQELHSYLYYNSLSIVNTLSSPPPQTQRFIVTVPAEPIHTHTHTVIRVTKNNTKYVPVTLRRSSRLAAKESLHELE